MKISGAYGGALNNILSDKKKNIEQLSSGKRINSAADDAAGLGISERLEAQTNEFATKARGLQNQISYYQVGDSGLSSMGSSINDLKTLLVQYNNDTLSGGEREILQNQADQLVSSIQDVLKGTEFNKQKVLGDLNLESLGLKEFSLAGEDAMGIIEEASQKIVQQRGEFGAQTNRLETEMTRLMVARENSLAANSRIEDADMLLATMNKTKGGILEAANTAVTAQAQLSQQRILDILKDG